MQTDFLDPTFDLTSVSFWPYRKPNFNPQYFHTSSNHPPNIKKQLPNIIAKRLSQNSSNKSEFEKAAPDYEKVLQKSGFNIKLQYIAPKKPKSRNRRRNTIWFNPQHNATVKTNIGKEFFCLLNKHFPKHSPLRKLFNRNNVKLSYSCTPSMSSIILSHNRELLQEKPTPAIPPTLCNCRKNTTCPLNGECCSKSLAYKAELTCDNITKYYYGLCETIFKTRYNNHKYTFSDTKISVTRQKYPTIQSDSV